MIINLTNIMYFFRVICFVVCNFYISIKILKKEKYIDVKSKIIFLGIAIVIAIICEFVSNFLFNMNGIIYIIILTSLVYAKITKSKLGYSILVNTISASINLIILFFSNIISFFLHLILNIKSEYINILTIISIYLVMVYLSMNHIRRIKNGITILKEHQNNKCLEIIILNISCVIIFFVIILTDYNKEMIGKMVPIIIIFSIIMFITIQKSLQLYYKQKMLVRDLEETKEELENKKKEIEELEKENLEFSKISHSIAHRQKSLEYKLNELSMKNEMADEISLRINSLNKALNKEVIVSLKKTEIPEIDDMLKYMKSECVKKKIDFQLQISGNIYKMINNYIKKEDLEILVADHIKNAIIAIEYSKNINRSILVRIGKLDETYGLYIYDSGIEFEIDTLLKLGKKPATTHKDSGGTGMGFMNTFDTLRKHNASFIIEEYGKPVTDNFTKVLKFKFDNKKEFKICTYRKEEIEKQDKEKVLKVENLMF